MGGCYRQKNLIPIYHSFEMALSGSKPCFGDATQHRENRFLLIHAHHVGFMLLSNHPSTFCCFIQSWVAGATVSAVTPRPPAHPAGPQDVPRSAERISPYTMSGTPLQGGVQEASETDAQATSASASRCGGVVALLRAPPG